ncbi:MAG TPA: hypothetical protein VIX35_05370, partial [Vicinamibacterales bacterium]
RARGGAAATPAAPVTASVRAAASGPRAITLTEAGSGELIGRLTESQLQCLVDVLEEESADDRDYYIDTATIDLLASVGADADLVEMLRRALGSRDGVEIAWAKA